MWLTPVRKAIAVVTDEELYRCKLQGNKSRLVF